MNSPDRLGITVEDVLREMESWPDAGSKRKTTDCLSEDQKKILCAMMRSGKMRSQIAAWWAEKGWPGANETTLRRAFKDLEKDGY